MNYSSTCMNNKKADNYSLLFFVMVLTRTSAMTMAINTSTTRLIVRLKRFIFFAVSCSALAGTALAVEYDSYSSSTGCLSDEFQCSDGKCIETRQVCDRIYDCSHDTTDEDDCHLVCSSDEFRCQNNQCVPKHFQHPRCDGTFHCSDKSDELNCPCPEGQLPCDRQPYYRQCYNKDGRCEHLSSCRDISDKEGCCTNDEFQCLTGVCVSRTKVCDGTEDCHDAFDEYDCPTNTTVPPPISRDSTMLYGPDFNGTNKCNYRNFGCADGNCIRLTYFCDGREDCGDGSDENQDTCQGQYCLDTQFYCRNRRCIDEHFHCDGIDHCRDNSDEENCPKWEPEIYFAVYPPREPAVTCASNEFYCKETNECINEIHVCDGLPDCTDKADEQDCRACTASEHTCKSGQCVPVTTTKGHICDGHNHCNDGSDEKNCPCPSGYFTCDDTGNSRHCLPKLYICNNRHECLDKTDEPGCCSTTEFQCADAGCISASLRCDTNFDCWDFSDEDNCDNRNVSSLVYTDSGRSTGEKAAIGAGVVAGAFYGGNVVRLYRKTAHMGGNSNFRNSPAKRLLAALVGATTCIVPSLFDRITEYLSRGAGRLVNDCNADLDSAPIPIADSDQPK